MVHKYTLIEKQTKKQNTEDLLCARHWMIHSQEGKPRSPLKGLMVWVR